MIAAVTVGFLAVHAIVRPEPVAGQNASASGTIGGRVTVDREQVRAFRVKARDTDHRLMYTVFTSNRSLNSEHTCRRWRSTQKEPFGLLSTGSR